MNLWIRSQDRERLIKVVNIEFAKDDYGYYLMANEDKFSKHKIATYKSKERALEVLDQIQKILFPNIIELFKNEDVLKHKSLNIYPNIEKPSIEYLHRDCWVYEMPQE